ncbi:PREDICTED: acid beta-fructofuranosidase 3, vacuolar [Tarenaya hassleriana]|uniref:acid beta-fructofuranosidase 3, vacuolar n=1 Tax=Tarenaya hassleriana TaxID=28532 RepID=UPI00053C2996|nr:PREDICTED: acid beta-fructofuranosidase 3, vacuolar [Tarenaya hassleriana]
MVSSGATLPITDPVPYTPLPDGSGSDPDPDPSRRRRPIFGPLAVSSGLFLIALYAALIATHDGSSPRAVVIDAGNATVAAKTRERIAGVSEKSGERWRFSGIRNGDPAMAEFPWDNSMLTWQRTAFHFQPEKNWMNDPNGPLFYKGWYHLFYQYNPKGAAWGDIIVWGHAVSEDLIHWLHLPLAMVPDQWYDANGVWTGSATTLDDGSVVMLYTGSTHEFAQVQNLAYPKDPNDPLLLQWEKYSGNPVLVSPPGIHRKDFRDPTTAWRTSAGKWRLTIGSKVNRTGISLLYDTADFKTFQQLPSLLHQVPDTGMWECVDFFPVSTTSVNGLDTSVNGPEVRHVMKASMDETRIDYYAIGTYFEENGTWVPDDATMDVGFGLRYDYGKFYASKTFYDQNKGRRILWSWVSESDSESADVKKGWSSLQSIPRTVALDTKTGKNLVQWPVEEIESLRLNSTEFKVEVGPGTIVPVDVGPAAQLDIEAEFEIEKAALERLAGDSAAAEEELSCRGAASRGALGPFGLSVISDEGLSEQTPVYFYVTKGKDSKLKTFFCTDTSRSSVANDVDKGIYGGFTPVFEGEKLTMRILVDHSIIEGFGQGGRTCITTRVYPTKAIYEGAKLFLFNNATGANVTASFKVWQMNNAFIHSSPDYDLPLTKNFTIRGIFVFTVLSFVLYLLYRSF